MVHIDHSTNGLHVHGIYMCILSRCTFSIGLAMPYAGAVYNRLLCVFLALAQVSITSEECFYNVWPVRMIFETPGVTKPLCNSHKYTLIWFYEDAIWSKYIFFSACSELKTNVTHLGAIMTLLSADASEDTSFLVLFINFSKLQHKISTRTKQILSGPVSGG